MKIKKLSMALAVTATTIGAVFAQDAASIKAKALLYLPMDKGNIMAHPKSGAEIEILEGKPVFIKGKKGDALAIDSEGVSIKGIKLVGDNLMNGEEGTVSYWMKPLVSYSEGKVRHYFLAARDGEGHLFFIDSPSTGYFMQTMKNKEWISPQFNFKWWKKPVWSTELWYHIAVTWGKGRETTFYVNGNKIFSKQVDNSLKLKSNAIYVGCNTDKTKQADAVIDELLVFGEVLDKDAVTTLMNDK